MQFKNNIINTALLGTDKKQISVSELPEELKSGFEAFEHEQSDSETKFLKTSSLALSFYKAGIQPVKLAIQPNEVPAEQLNYCSPESSKILKEILNNKYNTLIWYWCKLCAEKSLLVEPRILPGLFEWGVATKKYNANLFRAVIGNRGLWLSEFSDEWSFVSTIQESEDWETGNIQQRAKYLEKVREENPKTAIDKIQSVWKEENAANKVELIEILAINISRADEKFLIGILNDKSLKVKEKAWQLIKLIPDSDIIAKYQEIIRNSIRISQGKMLGLINKTNIESKLNLPNEDIFKTGIQNLSNNKKISDDDFILMQLIAEVPVNFWEMHFNCNPSEAVKLFATKDELIKFQASICNSVLKFKTKSWVKEILNQFNNVQVELLQLLDADDKCNYAEKFLNEKLNEVVTILQSPELKEWSIKFTKQLLSKTAENPNTYNKNFYESICIYLPSQILNDLDRFNPSEEWKSNLWKKLSQEIKELITIKEKIKNTI